MYPGDPTTPGYPAYENSTRTNNSNIPSIPSLPISWENAKILLEEIEGKNRTVRLTNHGALITPNPVFALTHHPPSRYQSYTDLEPHRCYPWVYQG